jgi:hypothetical protein
MGAALAQPPAGPAKSAPPVDQGTKADDKAARDAGPPPTILKPGDYPIDIGTALRLAGEENPQLLLARARLSQTVAERQLASAQLLPNLNLGTNYDMHRGRLQQSSGNILSVNRDALYYGLGANAIAAGTANIPGLNYNLNVGEAWYGSSLPGSASGPRRRKRPRSATRRSCGCAPRTSTCSAATAAAPSPPGTASRPPRSPDSPRSTPRRGRAGRPTPTAPRSS